MSQVLAMLRNSYHNQESTSSFLSFFEKHSTNIDILQTCSGTHPYENILICFGWLAPLLTARQPTQHSVINLLKKKGTQVTSPVFSSWWVYEQRKGWE
jgi:hypothetical protein